MTASRRRAGISIWAHPATVIVAVVLSAVGIVWQALFTGMTSGDSSGSLAIGLIVSLPVVLYTKYMIYRNTDRYALFYTTPLWDRQAWTAWNLLTSLPIALSPSAIALITDARHLPSFPGVLVPLLLTILAYPEQKRVYRAAQKRIRQMTEAHSD